MNFYLLILYDSSTLLYFIIAKYRLYYYSVWQVSNIFVSANMLFELLYFSVIMIPVSVHFIKNIGKSNIYFFLF